MGTVAFFLTLAYNKSVECCKSTVVPQNWYANLLIGRGRVGVPLRRVAYREGNVITPVISRQGTQPRGALIAKKIPRLK